MCVPFNTNERSCCELHSTLSLPIRIYVLANTFREQTHQEWNDKYLESFGLVTPDGKLTNAGTV